MVKTITVSSNSNYVTVTHGTGNTETLTINYSDKAYKDTNDNVIKNTYIKSLEIVEDDDTGHYNLIAYNGDNPSAEIFRIEVNAYSSQVSDEAKHATSADYATNAGTANNALTADKASNGDVITEYAKTFTSNDPNYGVQHLVTKDGDGNVISDINLFKRSRIVIGFKDSDPNNPTSPYSMNVSDSVTYEVAQTEMDNYGFSSIWDMLDAGVYTGYRNTSNTLVQWCPIYYSNGYYMISCFDYQGNAFKTFRLTKGTGDNDLIVERFL